MLDRRGFLKTVGAGGLLALMGAKPSASVPTIAISPLPVRWPHYVDTIAIDGSSGLDLEWLEEGDADYARELENARACGQAAIMVTIAPQGRYWLDDDAFHRAVSKLDFWHAVAGKHSDRLLLIDRASDLRRAHGEHRLGLIPWFQGSEPIGEHLERVAMFRERGVRVVQLTHNRRNLVGDGAQEPGNAGLSNFGHQLVEALNAERIVVDLAHGSQRTIAEGIAASKAPMLISHTGCRALADLPRNTGDAELRALAGRGGVAGIIFWPYLRTDTQPMAIDVIHHIEHAINVAGEDHVGIGTDGGVSPIQRTPRFERDNREWVRASKADNIFASGRPDDLYTFIPDLNVVNRFEALGAMLSARGHSDARIDKILGGNFARVFREVWGA